MRAALRGLSEKFGVACSVTWPAATSCNAWGAPGPHGCKKKPEHVGQCQCACGRANPHEQETSCGECGGPLIEAWYPEAPHLTARCLNCGTRHGARANPQGSDER